MAEAPAVNPEKGEVAILIGGKWRKMRFSFNEMCELDEEMGHVNSFLVMQKNGISMATLRTGLYIGLKVYNQKLTKDLVGRWIATDMDRLRYFNQTFVKAIALALPDSVKNAAAAEAAADAEAAEEEEGVVAPPPLEATAATTPAPAPPVSAAPAAPTPRPAGPARESNFTVPMGD